MLLGRYLNKRKTDVRRHKSRDLLVFRLQVNVTDQGAFCCWIAKAWINRNKCSLSYSVLTTKSTERRTVIFTRACQPNTRGILPLLPVLANQPREAYCHFHPCLPTNHKRLRSSHVSLRQVCSHK